MNPDFSPLSIGDISYDGTLAVPDTSNVQSSDQLPNFSPISPLDVAPLDNTNGTSINNNDGNATPALYSMFQTTTPMGGIVDFLTGGALGLADQLSGTYLNTPPNQTPQTNYMPLLVGAGALVFLLVVLK